MPDLFTEQIEQTQIWERELAEKRNKAKQAATMAAAAATSQDASNDPNQSQKQPMQNETAEMPPKTVFPTRMLALALCFDILGWIPVIDIICIITEPIAGIIFWRWQKNYAPDTDPIKSLLINKAVDLATIGVWPSNASLVIRAYLNKKA